MKQLVEDRTKRYAKRGNNEGDPRFMHADFEDLVKQGVGVCGRVGNLEYCDYCTLKPASIVFSIDELPKINYARKKESAYERRKRLKRKQPESFVDDLGLFK